MTQCLSCGGNCKKSVCKRENVEKLTIDDVDFLVLAFDYKLESKNYKNLVAYIDATLKEAYEQGKKDAAEWQPIETAPKNGKFIGCQLCDGNMDLAVLRDDNNKTFYHVSRDKFIGKSNFDFWMPLPKEPT